MWGSIHVPWGSLSYSGLDFYSYVYIVQFDIHRRSANYFCSTAITQTSNDVELQTMNDDLPLEPKLEQSNEDALHMMV